MFELRELKIEVTHDCLLHCSHCSSMAKENSLRTINWDVCQRIIHEAAGMGVTQITFSGGEPLLWKPLKDAFYLVNSYGMQIFLYTTGNVPNADQKLEELSVLGLSKVMFSIFGANQEEHEAITKVVGSYNTSLRLIQKCIQLNLEVEFHFVPLACNYQSLEPIVILAKKLGVSRVSLLRLVPQGRASLNDQLSPERNLHLRKIVIELRKQGYDIRTGSPYNFLMLGEEKSCCASIDRLTIGPDLCIFPCDAFKHILPRKLGVSSKFACLASNSLKECWNKSPYLQKIRQYLTNTLFEEPCKNCKNLDKCLSGCMAQKIYMHNELLKGPDPMCLKNIDDQLCEGIFNGNE